MLNSADGHEAVGLAAAVDLDVVESLAISLPRIRPSTYLGKGRVEEIAGQRPSDVAQQLRGWLAEDS